MNTLQAVYRRSLASLTDFYQLTMAHAYWRSDMAERMASFYWTFRSPPFDNGFVVTCGQQVLLEFLESFQFDAAAIDYLSGLRDRGGAPMFDTRFLSSLAQLRFAGDVDGLPEGSVGYPQTALLRVTAPLWQAQLIESPLLNLLNFQTLIATKAERVCEAAAGDSVLEFGLRRAQGIDGALSASRAAYVGGCAATSNTLAGELFGIPVQGTHAHSWVLAHEAEQEAFQRFAESMPGNCVLLVDTYDTRVGLERAIQVGLRMKQRGLSLAGVRLDSGDLDRLSRLAREMLDEAGLPEVAIVASNDLDENSIARLKSAGAPISIWGVGTRLVTAYDQPALGGVYKLSAIQDPLGDWQPRMKSSEEPIKATLPGRLMTWRIQGARGWLADVVADEANLFVADSRPCRDLTGRKCRTPQGEPRPLLVPLMRKGERCHPPLALSEVRERAQREARMARRWSKTHGQDYPVLLDEPLAAARQAGAAEQAGRRSWMEASEACD